MAECEESITIFFALMCLCKISKDLVEHKGKLPECTQWSQLCWRYVLTTFISKFLHPDPVHRFVQHRISSLGHTKPSQVPQLTRRRGEVANWGKGEMPLCSRTQWNFESLADQTSEILCWRFQFCAQLTPSNEKYWQKRPRKFYSQAIWPSFSRPSTQEGRGTWLEKTGRFVCFNLLFLGFS